MAHSLRHVKRPTIGQEVDRVCLGIEEPFDERARRIEDEIHPADRLGSGWIVVEDDHAPDFLWDLRRDRRWASLQICCRWHSVQLPSVPNGLNLSDLEYDVVRPLAEEAGQTAPPSHEDRSVGGKGRALKKSIDRLDRQADVV